MATVPWLTWILPPELTWVLCPGSHGCCPLAYLDTAPPSLPGHGHTCLLAHPGTSQLTWVLAAATPLDEADDEQDQHQEGDGTHESDEPALRGDICLVVGVSWQGSRKQRHE